MILSKFGDYQKIFDHTLLKCKKRLFEYLQGKLVRARKIMTQFTSTLWP